MRVPEWPLQRGLRVPDPYTDLSDEQREAFFDFMCAAAQQEMEDTIEGMAVEEQIAIFTEYAFWAEDPNL